MKFTITKNCHIENAQTYVSIELKKEDLGKLIADGLLRIDVPNLDGEIKLSLTVSVSELAPRGFKSE